MTYKQIMMTTPDRSLCEPARVSGRRHEGKFKCNAREAGDNPYGPRVFLPPPPHPLHPLSTSPNRPAEDEKEPSCPRRSLCSSPRGRLRGKEKGWGGCGRGGEKLLGPYVVFSAPPASHLHLKRLPDN